MKNFENSLRGFSLFLLVFTGIGWASTASAVNAKVVYIDPKLRFLVIDKGVFKDLAPGSHVCLLNDAGFIATCSGVVLANKSKAGLRLPVSEMKKLRVGSKVRLKMVYLKADGPRNLKSSSPRFYQAKAEPRSVPKSIERDAVKAEKMLTLRAPPPRAAEEPKQEELPEEITAPINPEPKTSPGPASPGIAMAEPEESISESGVEVEHDANKPYPEEIAEPLTIAENKVPNETPPPTAAKVEDENIAGLAEVETKVDSKNEAADGKQEASSMIDNVAQLFTKKVPIKFFRYEILGLRPLFSHIKFNYVEFDTITPESTERGSLWRENDKKKAPSTGLGLQLKIFGRGSWVYSVGWRYWNFDNYRSVETLDLSFPELVSDTKISVDSMAGWGELGKRRQIWGPFGYYYGFGLDIDESELKFQSLRKTNNGIERTDSLRAQEGIIGFSQSNLTVLSIRSTGSVEITAFNLGTSLTGTVILPVYTARQSYKATVNVPANVNMPSSGEDDLKRALGHEKGKFGLELSWGLFIHM